MGRTLPSIPQTFLQEQATFRRAPRPGDPQALDDRFTAAQKQRAA